MAWGEPVGWTTVGGQSQGGSAGSYYSSSSYANRAAQQQQPSRTFYQENAARVEQERAAAESAAAARAAVTSAYDQALGTLSGAESDAERMYQQGRQQALSHTAISSINAGMANTLNMPSAGIAYDQANRPAFNVGIAAQRAGIYQNLGQTAAGIYGIDVGAATSRHGIDVGASTARHGIDVGAQTAATGQSLSFASNQANQALQRYIADLSASTSLQQTQMQYGQQNNSGTPSTQRII